jgi:hypothetical protein
MAQPDFLGDGTTARRTDALWAVLVKELSRYQNSLGGSALPQNNPRRADTTRILRRKFLAALNGVPFQG